ncbi:alpha-ketoglutarate-dependent dioxygenase AlkB family protein [Luteolibacter luteus]|uniref:Alpha-ketoglutarate-dependent dioxygenase AlkB n=1 Tax=Luteolibacter luteus TaxID=2728835 RepID=A0A858RM18_9BACT|nr:alpha-ketoglutarate-dependent dioxygenase AlkB [Luteolibacter luteus]QJE98426.1 alpha-ketoglutarate-dependent dioxygenase AlkB [Luteolibacter luteus]
MDLFHQPGINLLPRDGIVNYYGCVLDRCDAWDYFEALMVTVPWRHDELVMFGKPVVTSRKVAWFGDSDFSYTYSGRTKKALPWTRELSALKRLVEERTGATFNSCLLNLYQNGGEGMGWHSDDEKDLVLDACIASMSLGAERRFDFRHKETKETVSILLEHGSLLAMKGETQRYWQHRLPPAKKIAEARINLTFRARVI